MLTHSCVGANLCCDVTTTKLFRPYQAIQTNNERRLSVLAMRNSTFLEKDISMHAKLSTRSTMDSLGMRLIRLVYRSNTNRPIACNTRTVTINPAQTMTNSRLRTATRNIQSPLLDCVGAGIAPEQLIIAHVRL